MAEETRNAKAVRQLYDGWVDGEFGVVEFYDENLEFVIEGAIAPEVVRVRGLQEMGRAWREWLGPWEGFKTGAIERLIEDESTVIVLHHVRARGKQSEFELDAFLAGVFTFEDGKIVRLVLTDPDAALQELGSER